MITKSVIGWACRQLFGTEKGAVLCAAIFGRFGLWIVRTETAVIERELNK